MRNNSDEQILETEYSDVSGIRLTEARGPDQNPNHKGGVAARSLIPRKL
jgi:hypothetical protein